jgi:S-adenosylmethionine/arginine decarboxylase-like enzyme
MFYIYPEKENKMNNNTWGYHLLLDCTAGDKELIGSKQNIREFITELVWAIDMIAFGDPWIERFATHSEDKAGISFCQMIETSNITGHFCDRDGNFYIDIFSCKPYNTDTVIELVNSYFKPQKIRQHYISRDA